MPNPDIRIQLPTRGPPLSLFVDGWRITRMLNVVAAWLAVSCLASVTLTGQATVRATVGAEARAPVTFSASPLRPTVGAEARTPVAFDATPLRPTPVARPSVCVEPAREMHGIVVVRCSAARARPRESEEYDPAAPTLAAYAPHARSDPHLIASMW
jgi:hypothetical protein